MQAFEARLASRCRSWGHCTPIDSHIVLPEQLSIPKANEAFDAGGALVDAKHKATLERICKQLVTTVGKLAG